MIRLARNQQNNWAVYSKEGFVEFKNIESAADHLVWTLNVRDDDIDKALIEMFALDKSVSLFDRGGNFIKVTDL